MRGAIIDRSLFVYTCFSPKKGCLAAARSLQVCAIFLVIKDLNVQRTWKSLDESKFCAANFMSDPFRTGLVVGGGGFSPLFVPYARTFDTFSLSVFYVALVFKQMTRCFRVPNCFNYRCASLFFCFNAICRVGRSGNEIQISCGHFETKRRLSFYY